MHLHFGSIFQPAMLDCRGVSYINPPKKSQPTRIPSQKYSHDECYFSLQQRHLDSKPHFWGMVAWRKGGTVGQDSKDTILHPPEMGVKFQPKRVCFFFGGEGSHCTPDWRSQCDQNLRTTSNPRDLGSGSDGIIHGYSKHDRNLEGTTFWKWSIKTKIRTFSQKNISLPKNHIQQYTRYLGISNKIQAYLTFFCQLFVVRIFGETPKHTTPKATNLNSSLCFSSASFIHPWAFNTTQVLPGRSTCCIRAVVILWGWFNFQTQLPLNLENG